MRPTQLAGRDGVRLAADELGDPDRPAVVLLHGGGQTRHAWGSTAQLLAEGSWHVFRVDLRGHGDSEWPVDGDYGPDAFAGDVYAIATAMPEPPVLVGASLGGIASLLAIGTHDGTVAVRGRVSDLLSEEGAQDLLRLIPHAEYVDVEGAGHMVAGDRNDLFNDAVVGFLDRLA